MWQVDRLMDLRGQYARRVCVRARVVCACVRPPLPSPRRAHCATDTHATRVGRRRRGRMCSAMHDTAEENS